jgi:choline dehydrogenase-like flavoprotein
VVHAKSDADVVAVRPAIQHDNVTLVRNVQVRRLETDPAGRTVTSVVADVDGTEQRFNGSIVAVSAGAANSARILLASANDKHPNGLANGSDQVGRNYMFHNSRAFLAISTEKNDTKFQKTLGFNDYYFGDEDFEFPMGNVQMVGKSSAPMYRGEKPIESGLAPTFALKDVAEHAVDFWLSAEDLPDRDNRVTINNASEIVLSYTPNNREPLEQLYHRVKKHLSHLGMHPHHLIPRDIYMKNDIPVAGCAHQAGTVRFGADPANSVLDTDCKAHELDNLYVVDTSFFPSIGAVNPALTAIANALRVGDHITQRLA